MVPGPGVGRLRTNDPRDPQCLARHDGKREERGRRREGWKEGEGLRWRGGLRPSTTTRPEPALPDERRRGGAGVKSSTGGVGERGGDGEASENGGSLGGGRVAWRVPGCASARVVESCAGADGTGARLLGYWAGPGRPSAVPSAEGGDPERRRLVGRPWRPWLVVPCCV